MDGAGTASQLRSLQSGSIGSPQEPGERISGEFRCSVAPIHDQALSHSPLVFGHLQDIDRRTLSSESKDPGPTLGPIFPPPTTAGLPRYNLSAITFFSPCFFEVWKMHTHAPSPQSR